MKVDTGNAFLGVRERKQCIFLFYSFQILSDYTLRRFYITEQVPSLHHIKPGMLPGRLLELGVCPRCLLLPLRLRDALYPARVLGSSQFTQEATTIEPSAKELSLAPFFTSSAKERGWGGFSSLGSMKRPQFRKGKS